MSKNAKSNKVNLTKRTTVHETFTRFVQAGALVVISYGPLAEKTAVIADIVDQNRVIIDGPTSGVSRQVISVRWLSLTQHRLPLNRGASTKNIKAALEKDDIVGKWKASPWGQKILGRQITAGLNDFERFQRRHSRKLVSHEIRKQYKIAKRAAAGLGPKTRKAGGAKGKPVVAKK